MWKRNKAKHVFKSCIASLFTFFEKVHAIMNLVFTEAATESVL